MLQCQQNDFRSFMCTQLFMTPWCSTQLICKSTQVVVDISFEPNKGVKHLEGKLDLEVNEDKDFGEKKCYKRTRRRI
jgi:hypothetical protein